MTKVVSKVGNTEDRNFLHASPGEKTKKPHSSAMC